MSIEMTLVDTVESVARVSAWAAVGVSSYAWYRQDATVWRWALFALVVCTAFAVDISSHWVPPKKAWWAESITLNAASLARGFAWTVWAIAVLYTPNYMFEVFWVLGGVLWGFNALGIVLYAFNDDFNTLFDSDRRDEARRVFRLIVHDVATAAFVSVLGANAGDVFDGDADDSHWRSMLSGAVVFQVFYALWSHWSELRVDGKTRCCAPKMAHVWRLLVRFGCFCALFVVILLRAHEDIVLVNMGIGAGGVTITLVACCILALTSRRGE